MIVNDLKYRVSLNNKSNLMAYSFLLSLLLLSFSVRANQDIYKNAGFYKTTVGSYVVTALFDGITTINEENLIIPNKESINQLTNRKFLKSSNMNAAVNSYLIDTGDKIILVDTGSSNLLGEKLGHVKENLIAAGYFPENVDVILLTHIHPDHSNGLISDSGKKIFKNAQVYVNYLEHEYWLNNKDFEKLPSEVKPIYDMAFSATQPYINDGRWNQFKEKLPIDGIKSVELYGHTPGHTGYIVSNDGEELLIWGDIIHNHLYQLSDPTVAVEFDVDKELAIKTRKKTLEYVSSNRVLIAGMHMPFPGIGYVVKNNNQYQWVPIEFGNN